MTVFECPKDGCDYAGDSLPALRSHANARTDHDWSELKDDVDDGDGDSSEEPTDGEEQEPAEEQTEASQTEEYGNQWEEGDDEPEPKSDEDESDDDDLDDSDDDGAASGTSTIGSGAALVAGSVLIALIALLTKDNDEPEEVPSESSDVPEDELDNFDGWGGFDE
jgi:hypothetical protein